MRQSLALVLRAANGETRKAGKLTTFRNRRVLTHYVHPQNLKSEVWGFAADALRVALEREVSDAMLGTKLERPGGTAWEQTYTVPIGLFASHGQVVDRGIWGSSVLLPAFLWEPIFEALPFIEAAEQIIPVTDLPWMGDDSLLIIETDGGMDGTNPGPIGAGVVVRDSAANVLCVLSEPLGYGTNNEAEYGALVAALAYAVDHGARTVKVRSDSELMVKQMRGDFQVKDAKIKPLHAKARELAARIGSFDIRWIPREENRMADKAAGEAAKKNAVQAALI